MDKEKIIEYWKEELESLELDLKLEESYQEIKNLTYKIEVIEETIELLSIQLQYKDN